MAKVIRGDPKRTVTRFISVTSSATPSVAENAAFSHTLTADVPVTWALHGGADLSRFTLSGANLQMTAKDFEIPVDANADNVYEVIVRATDERGFTKLQTINVTVTDVGAA